MKGDIQKLADSVFEAVKGYCATEFDRFFERAIAPFKRQIEELPKPLDGKDGRDGKDGADGRDGKDADPMVIASEVLDRVVKALEDLPPPANGKDGAPGERGERGEKGDPGERGERGEKGDPGERGERGERGIDGAPGGKGDPGERGADGLPGEPGQQGERGIDGAPGEKGERGERGEKGDPGDRGETGLPGQKGEPGLRGEKGADGIDGKNGAPGERGETGLPGEPGRDGRDGKTGEPGRDALQIDILPAIDPTRSYPRSTYAQWGGGLIRSTRTTDPIPNGGLLTDAGWSFIVRGISMVDVEQIDERNFEIRFMFNDGLVEKKAFNVPAQIYRGVYVEGKLYDRGDTVTWAGSQYHCDTPTSEKPGEGGAWRLSVKRGRDGKDGEMIRTGPAPQVKLGK